MWIIKRTVCQYSPLVLVVFLATGLYQASGQSTEPCGEPEFLCRTCIKGGVNNTDVCESCFPGFGLNATTQTCQLCGQNCARCTTIGARCESCIGGGDGFAPDENGGTCSACSNQNCQGVCITNGPGKCDSCRDGFGLNAESLCEPCGQNCLLCPISGAGKCDRCMRGYSLIANQTCIECDPNCDLCSQNGYLKCDPGSCKAGFVLNAMNQCELITTTTTSTTTTTTPTTTTTTPTTTTPTTTTPATTTAAVTTAAVATGSGNTGDGSGSTADNGGGNTGDGNTGNGGDGGTTAGNGGDSNTGDGSVTTANNGGGENTGDGSGSTTPSNGGNNGNGGGGGLSGDKLLGVILGTVLGVLALLFTLLCCICCCPYCDCCPVAAGMDDRYGRQVIHDDHIHTYTAYQDYQEPTYERIMRPGIPIRYNNYAIRSPAYFESGLKL